MTEHNFSVSPDECPACQEKRRSGRGHKPAAVPGIADVNGTAPGLVINRASRAAHDAVEKLCAEKAAKQAIADSWNEVVTDLNRNLSPPGGHSLK